MILLIKKQIFKKLSIRVYRLQKMFLFHIKSNKQKSSEIPENLQHAEDKYLYT